MSAWRRRHVQCHHNIIIISILIYNVNVNGMLAIQFVLIKVIQYLQYNVNDNVMHA